MKDDFMVIGKMKYYNKYENKEVVPFKAFLGNCFGIALNILPSNDIIIFSILVEDDESWYLSMEPVNFYWMEELNSLIGIVMKWVKENCIENEDGWVLKNER